VQCVEVITGVNRVRLIDADALIAKYGEWYTEEGTEEGYIGTVSGIVNKMPTEHPERKKGKWTIKNGELAFWDVCSECKKMVIHKAPFYNFCPNCGADMRGDDRNEI